MPTFTEVKDKVRIAFNRLLEEDYILLENTASEWAIAHKLAEHLQREFPDLNVDCDYNKVGKCTKYWYDWGKDKPFRPDIVVHVRLKKNNSSNLLAVEIKKHNNTRNLDKDRRKLKFLTGNSIYKYDYGLFMKIYVGKHYLKEPVFEWYENGEQIA